MFIWLKAHVWCPVDSVSPGKRQVRGSIHLRETEILALAGPPHESVSTSALRPKWLTELHHRLIPEEFSTTRWVFSETHQLWTPQYDNYKGRGPDSKRSCAFRKLRKQSSENPPFLRLRKRCPFSLEQGQGESSRKWLPPLQNVPLNRAHLTLATPRKKPTEDYSSGVAINYQLSGHLEGT